MSVSDADLQMLLDKQQIHDVMMRYCRSVDRMDIDLLKSCYWPDATDDHGPFKGPIEEFYKIVGAMSDAYSVTQHLICNEYVELDGDRACSESYFMMPAGLDGDGRKMWLLGGRYVDIFERRGGEWRIKDRTCVYDWDSISSRSEEVFAPNPFTQGERSTGDIVYRKRGEALGRA